MSNDLLATETVADRSGESHFCCTWHDTHVLSSYVVNFEYVAREWCASEWMFHVWFKKIVCVCASRSVHFKIAVNKLGKLWKLNDTETEMATSMNEPAATRNPIHDFVEIDLHFECTVLIGMIMIICLFVSLLTSFARLYSLFALILILIEIKNDLNRIKLNSKCKVAWWLLFKLVDWFVIRLQFHLSLYAIPMRKKCEFSIFARFESTRTCSLLFKWALSRELCPELVFPFLFIYNNYWLYSVLCSQSIGFSFELIGCCCWVWVVSFSRFYICVFRFNSLVWVLLVLVSFRLVIV